MTSYTTQLSLLQFGIGDDVLPVPDAGIGAGDQQLLLGLYAFLNEEVAPAPPGYWWFIYA